MFAVPLIPESLSFYEFWLLAGLSFFTSMLTAAIGIGGGSLLLAVMAQVLPVKAIIPVHGVVQLGSNFGRAAVMLPHVEKRLFVWFLLGSLIGAIAGGQIVFSLPVDILRLILGTFILYAAWGPKLGGLAKSEKMLAVGGFFSTMLTMFVGATGPFVLAMLKPFGLSPMGVVASTAGCLVVQHSLKVLVFGLLGFAFAPYLPLMALMIGLGFVGTLVGRKILLKVDEKLFKRALNIVLTLLALRLLWQGAAGLV